MLHIINQSPFSSDQLHSCLRFLQANDALVLIENAVFAATESNDLSALISALSPEISIYALEADLTARGITDPILQRIQKISYTEFVYLTVKHPQITSWS